jgi:putative FmdB family regulatory protein
MPTYHYRCSNCGNEFEKFQSIKAEPCKECPDCHKDTLTKVLSGGVGIIFKGSGFYITDYKNKTGNSKSDVKKTAGKSKEEKPKQSNEDKNEN